jgi:phospholipid transport system substrate-binding protein
MNCFCSLPVRAFAALAFILVWASPCAAEEEAPVAIIQKSIDQIISILNSDAYKTAANKEQAREQIYGIVESRFAWEEMGKRSLGQLWKNQNKDDQARYVDLYRQLLKTTYIDKLEGFSGEKVVYDKENIKDRFAEVQTQIVRPAGDKIPVYYRMVSTDKGWQVYDVVIEGVSLIKNYRSQFEEILADHAFVDFLKKIEEKILELKKAPEQEQK